MALWVEMLSRLIQEISGEGSKGTAGILTFFCNWIDWRIFENLWLAMAKCKNRAFANLLNRCSFLFPKQVNISR